MNKQILSKTFSIFLALSFILSNSAMLVPLQAEACEKKICEDVIVVSNTEDKVFDIAENPPGETAVLAWDDHPAWTAVINDANWIWKTEYVENPDQDETYIFKKDFDIVGIPDSATLKVATDNSYKVWINNVLIGEDAAENNHSLTSQDQYDNIINLHTGSNDIKFEVRNWALLPEGTWESNPAGLLYRLEIVRSSCEPQCVPQSCTEINCNDDLDDDCDGFIDGEDSDCQMLIMASKVICDNESDLPNWGTGSGVGYPSGGIDQNTASDYVTQHSGCHLVPDWFFQWGQQGSGDFGRDFYGEASNSYTTFGPTDDNGVASTTIDSVTGSYLELREVLQQGYIPFTYDQSHQSNDDSVSAEFYCNDDVLNYDNWDYINSPVLGETYYCVGFNTPLRYSCNTKTWQCNLDQEGGYLSEEECLTDCHEPELICEPGIELLKNGSFEFPKVTDSKKWQLFPSGAIGLEWLVEWADTLITGPALLELQEGVNGWLPSHGDQHAELDSNHPTMISQEIQTLSGYEYTLTFDFSARPKTDLDNNKLEIHAGGTLLDTIQKENSTNQTSWEPKIYNFVADSGITEIKFVDAGIDDSLGTFLDNVSLECVGPEQQPICGNDVKEGNEECDGADGVTEGENFCSTSCHLIPIYNGDNSCPQGTEPEFVQSYSIGAQDINGEVVPVEENKVYLFTASDTFYPTQDGKNQNFKSDAAYTTEDGWTSTSTQYGIQGTPPDYAAHALLGDLGLGVGVINWGNYDSSHEYDFSYTIPSSFTSAQFVIGDRYGDWFDTPWQNQGGMNDNLGSLTLDVYECKPSDPGPQTSTVTICKYDEQRDPLEDWNLFLKGDSVQSLTVYPRNTSGDNNEVTTSNALSLDDYLLIASGEYTYRPGTLGAEYSDAGYTKRKCPGDASYLCSGTYSPWFNVYDIVGLHQGYLGIMINDNPTDWGSYFNSLHTYATSSAGYSGSFDFTIKDDVYIDNSGELYVDIYKGYSGYTGSGGCVIFDDVPFGTYTIGEILKNGWQNINGLVEVIIDQSEENFEVINTLPQPLECDPEIELLENGGFETPTVLHDAKWNIFASGTSGLGWIVNWRQIWPSTPENSQPKIANLEIQKSFYTPTVSPGDQYAELDTDWHGPGGPSGEPASVAISQNIPTIIGETYKLTFDFSPRPGLGIDENWLKAFVDGTEAFNQTADGFITSGQTSWSNHEYSFTAENNITTIKFEDWGSANSLGTFLDNVSLRCIREEEPTMYRCNEEWQCEEDPEGQYETFQDCEEECREPTPTSTTTTTTTSTTTTTTTLPKTPSMYSCNSSTLGCVPDAHGQFGSLQGCKDACGASAGPGGQYLGLVLGAATEKKEGPCGLYLLEHIKYGGDNNPEEVKKLQYFLNEYLGTNLEITGAYNQATYQAVMRFQLLLNDEILAPWVEVNCLPSGNIATGYVYRTTQWKINMIVCPELNLPVPNLYDETCKYISLDTNGGIVAGAATSTVIGIDETTTTTTSTTTPETIGDTTTTTPQDNGKRQSQDWLWVLIGFLVIGGTAYLVYQTRQV